MSAIGKKLARILVGTFASVAVAAPGFAQTIPATVDKPVTITFYNYNLASAGIGADGTKKLIAEFMAANPMIKVDGVGVPSTEMNSRILADVAAGRGPDLAQVVFDGLDFVANNMGASALEDIVPADELAEHFNGMSKNGLELGVLDGKTYALAYTFSTPVLFYNADLFRKAGLDPDSPPKNWAEIKETALTIQDKTDAKGFSTGVVGAAASGFDWLLQSVLLSNGGRVMSEDRKTLTFAEPAAAGAVKMLRELHDAGVLENSSSGSNLESMNAGGTAMFLNTSAYQRALIAGAEGKYELRAAPMPGFGDTLATPTNSGSGLVILSHDPLKQRAAWEFMKFLTSKRGYTIITSEIGYLPLRTDIVNDPAYLKDWVAEHPLIQPNLAQLERLQPWTPFPGSNYRQILKTMMDAMEQAVFGGGDVDATLKAAQDQAQALMPNNT
ncbi:ABC transporter substrate-binding protein [Rhizobium sp. L1K21]|uniref:ABC transporter substrate-binding protein n=1 Tax=Rhizobium sp. L1K21 TaxID=2954933 RepID=UPI00209318C3|nr:ABC transporter substrate-binding protein [Rhizobium sp. L1K21]MCO6187601.1 ABC transporter substrate-binding protein [Rhizobium sp. L1K21]